MSLNWPIPSFVGEQYTAAGSTWEWNGEAWQSLGPGSPGATGATGASTSLGMFGLIVPTGSFSNVSNSYFGQGGSSAIFTANRNYAFPIIPAQNLLMNSYSIDVVSTSFFTAEVKLAMYDHDYATARPKNRIISSSGILTTTPGIKTWSTGNVNLNAGEVYWFTIMTNNSNTLIRGLNAEAFNFTSGTQGYEDITTTYSSGPPSTFTVSGAVSGSGLVLQVILNVKSI